MPQQPHDQASLDDTARELLGSLPERWGRMDLMSRTALVEVGLALRAHKMLEEDSCALEAGWTGGLIVGSEKGSLAIDKEYAKTLKDGPGMASPHLFGYTLPNIPLAEAAIQYGLTGPVYSVFVDDPGSGGEAEARRWLDCDDSLDFMVVGELDVYPVSLHNNSGKGQQAFNQIKEIVSVNFRIVS